MRKHYDYLVVGAGLFGAVFAHEAVKAGFTVLVLEKRDHIAGNIYCAEEEGILIHRYGAHIFHTSDEDVWEFVNQFVSFNNFINSPKTPPKASTPRFFNMGRIISQIPSAAPVEEETATEIAILYANNATISS